jgi:hypothetical protein
VLREFGEASEMDTPETYARHIAELVLSGIVPKAIARKGRVKAPFSKQRDTGSPSNAPTCTLSMPKSPQ